MLLPGLRGAGLQDRLPGHPRLPWWGWQGDGEAGDALPQVRSGQVTWTSFLCGLLRYGRKVWLTEFAKCCTRDQDEVIDFVKVNWGKRPEREILTAGDHSPPGGGRVRGGLLLVHHEVQREELHRLLVSRLSQQAAGERQLATVSCGRTF